MVINAKVMRLRPIIFFKVAGTSSLFLGLRSRSEICILNENARYMLMKNAPTANIIFIPNKVVTKQEGSVLFDKMNTITAKFLGVALNFIGSISESSDYSLAWNKGKAAVSIGESTTCYHDFAAIVDELDKVSISPKGNDIQFFNSTK